MGTQATGAVVPHTGNAQSSLQTPAGGVSLANSTSKESAAGNV